MTCQPQGLLPLELSNYLAHGHGPTSADAHVEALLMALRNRTLSYAHREVVDHLAHNEPSLCRPLVAQLVHIDGRRRERAWSVIEEAVRHAAQAAAGLAVLRGRREGVSL